MNKIWDKNNSVTPRLSGEFMDSDDNNNPLGPEMKNLIKLPGITDAFFRMMNMFEDSIDFITDEPLFEGVLKGFYSIDLEYTGEIEVYDNDKNFIRKCTVKDLQDIFHDFLQPFIDAASDKIIRITAPESWGKPQMNIICVVEYSNTPECFEIRPIMYKPEDEWFIRKYHYLFADHIVENDLKIEILDMPGSFKI